MLRSLAGVPLGAKGFLFPLISNLVANQAKH